MTSRVRVLAAVWQRDGSCAALRGGISCRHKQFRVTPERTASSEWAGGTGLLADLLARPLDTVMVAYLLPPRAADPSTATPSGGVARGSHNTGSVAARWQQIATLSLPFGPRARRSSPRPGALPLGARR